MENSVDMAKQILSIQKTIVDNTFKAQALFQEQGERMARAALASAGGWPVDSDRLWQEWAVALQEGRSNVKALVDAQFDMLDSLLEPLKQKG
jgi:hypothetical protein